MRWLLVLLVLVLPGCADTTRITAAGDYDKTDQTAAVLDLIAQRDPDAHFAVGDLSYGGAESQWCDFVTERVGDLPFQLLAGNHESNGQDGQIERFAECLPNRLPGLVGRYGREYYVDLPGVRVIAASPGLEFPEGRWEYAVGDPHYTWLADAIDRAPSDSFVVVAVHLPCSSLGVHGCALPEQVRDLLIDRRVDLVLHGHEHHYARTHQLHCPTCVADSDNSYVSGAGTVFATVGTGGIWLREPDRDVPGAEVFASISADTWGVLEIEVGDGLLRAEFLPAAGGVHRDRFTIAAAGR